MITSYFKTKSRKQVKPLASEEPTQGDNGRKRQTTDDTTTSDESKKRVKTDQSTPPSSEQSSGLLSQLDVCESSIAKGEKAWRDALLKHSTSTSFQRLEQFVTQQRKSHKVFPPVNDTFSALNWTPLDQVKVVIVGQDPYHGPNQAHGLCFSVRKGVKIPPSLRNIYKELAQDSKVPDFRMPNHGYLERWAKQGVLMINTVLTVRQGEANSHKNRGWELVTDEIIRAVDRRAKAQNKGVVFLLWGKPATKKCETALGSTSAQARHTIICTSHPSPLGATKTNSPFLGSKCFSRANEALRDLGYDEIDWNVDGDL